ncbi:MAG: hypothetical protein LN415_04210 [Candidatus Thermoplasmatota archaeon]|nr:hypothetical protein [Candidatus Thermoplasmatota archaeon]
MNQAEFEAIHKISEEQGISIYALLKKALFRYLLVLTDKVPDNLSNGLLVVTEKAADKLGDRFPVLTDKVADAFDDDKLAHWGESFARRLLEAEKEREEERIALLLQTLRRISELPPEKVDAYVASLEGLLKQVKSEKPP